MLRGVGNGRKLLWDRRRVHIPSRKNIGIGRQSAYLHRMAAQRFLPHQLHRIAVASIQLRVGVHGVVRLPLAAGVRGCTLFGFQQLLRGLGHTRRGFLACRLCGFARRRHTVTLKAHQQPCSLALRLGKGRPWKRDLPAHLHAASRHRGFRRAHRRRRKPRGGKRRVGRPGIAAGFIVQADLVPQQARLPGAQSGRQRIHHRGRGGRLQQALPDSLTRSRIHGPADRRALVALEQQPVCAAPRHCPVQRHGVSQAVCTEIEHGIRQLERGRQRRARIAAAAEQKRHTSERRREAENHHGKAKPSRAASPA